MKPIVISKQHKSQFKLIVTPTEIRIKTQKFISGDLKERIVDYLKVISDKPEMKQCTQTWRGNFKYIEEVGFIPKITMYTWDKKEHITYGL
jgi:hypothetical protein